MSIETMNQLLAAEDDRLTADFSAPRFPVTYIFSQPRSASTLFTQVALNCYRVGYVSNLLSRYYRAPMLGASVEQSLVDPEFRSSLATKHVTVGAHEPHEWGHFWRYWLGLRGDEHYCAPETEFDGHGLARKIAALESVYDRPFIFDNVFAMTNFERVREATPNFLVVYMRRDPFYVCNSLIHARLDRHGDLGAWYGQRPRNIDALLTVDDPVEQIVAQVYSIEQEIEASVARLAPERVLRVDYDAFVETPQEHAGRFATRLDELGVSLSPRKTAELELRSRNRSDLIHPQYRERLIQAYSLRFGVDALPFGVA